MRRSSSRKAIIHKNANVIIAQIGDIEAYLVEPADKWKKHKKSVLQIVNKITELRGQIKAGTISKEDLADLKTGEKIRDMIAAQGELVTKSRKADAKYAELFGALNAVRKSYKQQGKTEADEALAKKLTELAECLKTATGAADFAGECAGEFETLLKDAKLLLGALLKEAKDAT